MTIEDSLILLNNTKQSIKTAIENKGVTVGSIPFAQYPGKIGDISTGLELPEIGDSFGGGYFMGTIQLSDGVYASIVSPYTGGNTGSRSNGTSSAWGFSPEYLDPRVGDANMPNTNAKASINGLTLGGKSDWMLPTLLQAINWIGFVIQHGWVDDERGFPQSSGHGVVTCTENGASSSQYIYAGAFNNLQNVQAIPINKTSNSNARAFRLEKLD